MDADLMCASGFQLTADQRLFLLLPAAQHFDMSHRRLAGRGNPIGLCVMPVPADRFVKRQSVLRLHDAADHRQIRSGDLLPGQSLIQLRLKKRTLAEKHDPAGAFVQPVNRPDSAMLAGSQIIRRHRVGQRAGLSFIIRMDDHAGRLGHRQDQFIFIQNPDRDCPRNKIRFFLLKHLQHQLVADLYLRTLPYWLTIQCNSLFNFQLVARSLGTSPGRKQFRDRLTFGFRGDGKPQPGRIDPQRHQSRPSGNR